MKNKCCETCKFYKNGWCELFFVEQKPDHKCESDYEPKNDIMQKGRQAKMSDCFEPWDVLWKAPDGTFKGRCDNCGFVHVFIEGHMAQYKFCPQCGEQKQEE